MKKIVIDLRNDEYEKLKEKSARNYKSIKDYCKYIITEEIL
jgi:hypothetical protein